MSQLHAFVVKYPPNDVPTPPPTPHFRSTHTSLIGQCMVVRMTGLMEVPDDNVSPLMALCVEILHHWLIDEARVKDIKYVMQLCNAYECGLRRQRNGAVLELSSQNLLGLRLRLWLLELRFSITVG